MAVGANIFGVENEFYGNFNLQKMIFTETFTENEFYRNEMNFTETFS